MKKIDFCFIFVAVTLYVALISTICAKIVVNQAIEDILTRQETFLEDIDTRIAQIPVVVESVIKDEFETRSSVPETAEQDSDILPYGAEIIETPETLFVEPTYKPSLTEKEIDLVALVTMAEAEDEPEKGQRLVIDTILNRVESSRFPNTVEGVVYQTKPAVQFTSMWNGRVDKCYVRDDIRQLVIEELQNRLNSEVLFFQMYDYNDFAIPMFQVGGHYFSKY